MSDEKDKDNGADAPVSEVAATVAAYCASSMGMFIFNKLAVKAIGCRTPPTFAYPHLNTLAALLAFATQELAVHPNHRANDR